MFQVSFFNSKRKGFTLIELLIYSGVLVISASLITGIVQIVSRANIKTQVDEELNNQSMIFEEIFRQKIQTAKSINSISGSFLNLEMSETNKDPTIFSLNDDVVFIEEGSTSPLALNDSDKIKVTSLIFSLTGPETSNISNSYHYAWSGNVGWIDFAYPGGNVRVPIGAGDLNGGAYVLSDDSWISLNCIFTDSCSSVNYKVSSDANGNLAGWAWSENFGWISFASTTPVTYGVTVATSTGEFDGYAWSENIGWISFNCKTGGDGQADICGISDYKVQDLRLRTSAVKVDITLQYNSDKPELAISRTNTFVFNIITPTK
ncbi:MAG: prepilin-type N-terminal cleavage/methylation domain-containing protein [Caldisericia bacterium]|nr:prepilin-type N-terminal cleavage/methylation domain-containing protein [Caldisericia bacterium]